MKEGSYFFVRQADPRFFVVTRAHHPAYIELTCQKRREKITEKLTLVAALPSLHTAEPRLQRPDSPAGSHALAPRGYEGRVRTNSLIAGEHAHTDVATHVATLPARIPNVPRVCQMPDARKMH